MSILSSILAPQFIVNNIILIGQIISVMILVIFDDFFTRVVVFHGVDKLEAFILQKSREKFSKFWRFIIKYSFEFLATIIFLGYFFAGYLVLSEYIITPILQRLLHIILIIVIVLFLIMSWILNNKKARKKYLGYN